VQIHLPHLLSQLTTERGWLQRLGHHSCQQITISLLQVSQLTIVFVKAPWIFGFLVRLLPAQLWVIVFLYRGKIVSNLVPQRGHRLIVYRIFFHADFTDHLVVILVEATHLIGVGRNDRFRTGFLFCSFSQRDQRLCCQRAMDGVIVLDKISVLVD